jgi:hypothetical protein
MPASSRRWKRRCNGCRSTVPEFGKVVVFRQVDDGTGLIGGSFALALKEAEAVEEVGRFRPHAVDLAHRPGTGRDRPCRHQPDARNRGCRHRSGRDAGGADAGNLRAHRSLPRAEHHRHRWRFDQGRRRCRSAVLRWASGISASSSPPIRSPVPRTAARRRRAGISTRARRSSSRRCRKTRTMRSTTSSAPGRCAVPISTN